MKNSPLSAAPAATSGSNLMDLLGGITDLGPPAAAAPLGGGDLGGLGDVLPQAGAGLGGALGDLGALNLNGSVMSSVLPPANNAMNTNGGGGMNVLNDLLGGGGVGPPTGGPAPTVAYEKNSVRITAEGFERGLTPGEVTMRFVATTTSPSPLSDFVLQVAVPKSMQIKLEPASGTGLAAGGAPIRQALTVKNPKNAQLKMKLRVEYKLGDSTPVQDMAQVDNFPQEVSTW